MPEEILRDFGKFLGFKLFLIEQEYNKVLLKESTKEEYKKVLNEIRKICNGSYEEITRRAKK